MKYKFNRLEHLRHNYLRSEIILTCDILISTFASIVTIFGVKLAVYPGFYSLRFLITYLAAAVLSTALLFILLKTFRIIIRHFGIKDLLPFLAASFGKGLVVSAVLAFAGMFNTLMLIIIALDAFLTFCLLIGIRLMMIVVYDALNRKLQENHERTRILVFGTSDKSVATIVRLNSSTHYRLIGFIDHSSRKVKMSIEQYPVFAFDSEKDIDRILSENGIDAILFAKDTEARSEENFLIKESAKKGVKILIVPQVDEITDGQSILRPREVKVEDLLGRNEIQISLDEIKSYFAGKTVMVTGAAGSIGSELVRQLAGFKVGKLVLYDNAETPMHNLRLELEGKFPDLDFVPVIGDVRAPARLDFAFRSFRPQVVCHAAAYQHVPLMEENPCEAVLVNVFGTRNVADKCLDYGVEKMVMISTDKAVNPTNIMGCTKRLAEIYVQSLGLAIERGQREGRTKFVTTRFGNVLGSNGSVIPRFREQIAAGGPVTVTHPDINRYFMTIPEACRLVMEAATLSTGNQIFVFDMGKPVKIDILARRMITLAGFTPDVDINIEYTGLRPGEKLYEEVLSDKENTMPAFHERIRIAKVREYDYQDALKAVEGLEDLARKVEIPDMVRLMKITVPEFKSDNSQFSEIDRELERELGRK